MSKKIMFRMAARCEAAGRPNNEDNYQLDDNLADDVWGFSADKVVELGPKGSLLVVCDGMGGMNAGEVASSIAVATVKQFFSNENLTDKVLASPTNYIALAIKEADRAIKAHQVDHPETSGMGSTIVIAWVLGQKVHVGWCGDSRCYCFNQANGLVRLSHDHSYVQELVDAGKLTEELAFDHPNNNIITRSLGDPNGPARPDVKSFDLHVDDIIMLCSDGLCGCLRDNEIEEQIRLHHSSMQECRDALWVADERAGWHDNVTICLLQVVAGASEAEAAPCADAISDSKAKLLAANRKLKIIILSLVVLLVAGGAGTLFMNMDSLMGNNSNAECEKPIERDSIDNDTVSGKQIDGQEQYYDDRESQGMGTSAKKKDVPQESSSDEIKVKLADSDAPTEQSGNTEKPGNTESSTKDGNATSSGNDQNPSGATEGGGVTQSKSGVSQKNVITK